MDKYLDIIESHFKMDFKSIINELHLKQGRSINELSRDVGISHTPFVRLAKKFNLTFRNKPEASTLNISKNNPIFLDDARFNRAKSVKQYLIEKNLKQELLFKSILLKSNKQFIEQHPIGPYNIDFYIQDSRLCIEIDSTKKWGKEKRLKAYQRDSYLKENGYWVLRINKLWLDDYSFIKNILKAYNIIID